MPQTGTQAVDRAARLLVEVVRSDQPVDFGTLVSAATLPKSTVSRLLGSLERHGLLQRERDGAFRPGPELAHYARRGGGEADLVAAAQPFLERLGERTGETVNLGVPGRPGVAQIAQVDSCYLLGATNWVGLSVPYHCSAMGKLFLAFHAAEMPPGRLERRTDRTQTDRVALAADLTAVVRRGYAVSDGELEPDLVAVAAPVRSGPALVAAVSVSGPAGRLAGARIEAVAASCVAEAAALSAHLGERLPKEGVA